MTISIGINKEYEISVKTVYLNDNSFKKVYKEERMKAIRTMSANGFCDADIEKAGYTKEEIKEARTGIVSSKE